MKSSLQPHRVSRFLCFRRMPQAPAQGREAGFTFVELVVVVAVLACLAGIMAPAMARTRPHSQSFQCLNNHRQMGAAWRMYAEDSGGVFCYASPSVASGPPGTSPNRADDYAWSGAYTDYNAANRANWDPRYDMMQRPLWPYVKSTSPYKCPADRSTIMTFSGIKPRILSIAMNIYVGGFAPYPRGVWGTDGGWSWAHPYLIYPTLSFLNGPKGPPDKIFVFLDMREDQLSWGSFITDMSGYSPTTPYPTSYGLQDLPGYYHERGCSFAMADGHVEMKRWLDARTVPVLGTSSPGSGWRSPGNPDVAWLQDHSTRPR